MQTKLAHVPLTDITVSTTNKMFREESELSETALKELIDSIKTNGVISPVMLTPRSDGPTKYMLVCGERRFRAAGFAGLQTLPCNIRELTDDQVLDLQLIENIERKDVHPSKEAKAYKLYMEKHPEVTIPDMALKFAKTEHYIQIRLKLNDLIPEAMDDFSKDLMSIGHAMHIARLTPADQKRVIDRCSDTYQDGKQKVKYYATVQDVKEFIDESVVCNLSSVAFKKDDATLLPKAGACTACPKRSGASQLFADIKADDRCFDPACFRAKRMQFLVTQIPDILEKQPEIVFLIDSQEKVVNPEISNILKKNKVTPLTPYDDYVTYSYHYNSAKMKGIYITGDRLGMMATVYSTREKSKPSKSNDQNTVSAKVAIERIKERTKRAAELDQEKVYSAVIEALKNDKNFLSNTTQNPTDAEWGLIAQFLYNHADYRTREYIDKVLKLKSSNSQKEAEEFKKLSDRHLAAMARQIAVNQYSAPYQHNSTEGLLILEMAETWNVPVKDLVAQQLEIRKKREARAKERIAALQAEIKKKPKKAKAKAQPKKQKT